MLLEQFEALVKPEKFQVFLFSSPVPKPLHLFAVHAWFVVNLRGEIHRWEFGRFRDSPHPGKIGILHNHVPPTAGMRTQYFWHSERRFASALHGVIEGDAGSRVAEMAEFIHRASGEYPMRRRYVLVGPNSNSYAQRMLDHFPGSGLELPWNAVGRWYKVKDRHEGSA